MKSMKKLSKQQAPKKSVDLIIDCDLQTRVKELNIDVSSTPESTPKQELVRRHDRQWKTKNRTAIKVYKDFVENNGCFSDNYRFF